MSFHRAKTCIMWTNTTFETKKTKIYRVCKYCFSKPKANIFISVSEYVISICKLWLSAKCGNKSIDVELFGSAECSFPHVLAGCYSLCLTAMLLRGSWLSDLRRFTWELLGFDIFPLKKTNKQTKIPLCVACSWWDFWVWRNEIESRVIAVKLEASWLDGQFLHVAWQSRSQWWISRKAKSEAY